MSCLPIESCWSFCLISRSFQNQKCVQIISRAIAAISRIIYTYYSGENPTGYRNFEGGI